MSVLEQALEAQRSTKRSHFAPPEYRANISGRFTSSRVVCSKKSEKNANYLQDLREE